MGVPRELRQVGRALLRALPCWEPQMPPVGLDLLSSKERQPPGTCPCEVTVALTQSPHSQPVCMYTLCYHHPPRGSPRATELLATLGEGPGPELRDVPGRVSGMCLAHGRAFGGAEPRVLGGGLWLEGRSTGCVRWGPTQAVSVLQASGRGGHGVHWFGAPRLRRKGGVDSSCQHRHPPPGSALGPALGAVTAVRGCQV